MLTLAAVIAIFFLAGRSQGYAQFGVAQTILRILVALPLLLSGVILHFFMANGTASIIPPAFPDPRLLVILSGVCEIAGAIGLFLPATRRIAGFLIAVMLIAILPANIYAAGKTISGVTMPTVSVRTAMQAVYILMVLIASYGCPRLSQAPDR
jgi:uncharacterized membrane protein